MARGPGGIVFCTDHLLDWPGQHLHAFSFRKKPPSKKIHDQMGGLNDCQDGLGTYLEKNYPSSHVHMLVFARVLKYPISWPWCVLFFLPREWVMWRYTPTSNSLTLCFTRLWMIISVGTKSTSPKHPAPHMWPSTHLYKIQSHTYQTTTPPSSPFTRWHPRQLTIGLPRPIRQLPITCGEIPRHMPHTILNHIKY